MAIERVLRIETVVVVANDPDRKFNPAEFSKYWLDSNGIVSATSIDPKQSFFSPEVTRVYTSGFNFIVWPEQFLITAESPEEFERVMTEICPKIIDNMDFSVATGMGVNLVWSVNNSDYEYKEYSKILFDNSLSPVSKFFQDNNSAFGAYYSKDLDNGIRLKLDVKPATMLDKRVGEKEEVIQFVFNFHKNLKNDGAHEIGIVFQMYTELLRISTDIINSIK